MLRTLDYLRVSLLGVLLVGLLGNLVYTISSTSDFFKQAMKMKTDYKLCKPFEKQGGDDGTLKSCKEIVDIAFVEANDKCQRYIESHRFCKDKVKKGCERYQNNVYGCINMILVDHFSRWREKGKLRGGERRLM